MLKKKIKKIAPDVSLDACGVNSSTSGARGVVRKLKECEKLKQEYLKGWQRERADFLNYKKGEMNRLQDLLNHFSESMILEILPILDNLERAEKNLPEKLKKDDNVKGLLQIEKQIKNFLKGKDLKPIKSLGEKFNPEFHEVAEQIETANKGSSVIIEEIQKGYKLQGKLVRPAKVRVSK